jgi:hypothetical protein
MRLHKKASKAVHEGASRRLQLQKSVVAVVAVIAVMMIFWLSTVPAISWYERTGQAAELRDARELWLSSTSNNYEFEYSVACLCDESTAQPVTVRVRENEFERAFVAATGERLDTSGTSVIPRTMDDIFDNVSRQIDGRPASLEVAYDTDLGYPLSIRVDYDAETDGDEVGYYVRDLRILSAE